jgi:hypothetical protein
VLRQDRVCIIFVCVSVKLLVSSPTLLSPNASALLLISRNFDVREYVQDMKLEVCVHLRPRFIGPARALSSVLIDFSEILEQKKAKHDGENGDGAPETPGREMRYPLVARSGAPVELGAVKLEMAFFTDDEVRVAPRNTLTRRIAGSGSCCRVHTQSTATACSIVARCRRGYADVARCLEIITAGDAAISVVWFDVDVVVVVVVEDANSNSSDRGTRRATGRAAHATLDDERVDDSRRHRHRMRTGRRRDRLAYSLSSRCDA